jgi:hypothetical protein
MAGKSGRVIANASNKSHWTGRSEGWLDRNELGMKTSLAFKKNSVRAAGCSQVSWSGMQANSYSLAEI